MPNLNISSLLCSVLSFCAAVTRIGARQVNLCFADTVPDLRCSSVFQKAQPSRWLHFQTLLTLIGRAQQPFQHCAPRQAGQGEVIIKPCFLEMLSIARSDYDVVCLSRDKPQPGLLFSVLQPGLGFGKLLASCKGRNALGARTPEVWYLCNLFTCFGLVWKSRYGNSVVLRQYLECTSVLYMRMFCLSGKLLQPWHHVPQSFCFPEERVTDIYICRHDINTLWNEADLLLSLPPLANLHAVLIWLEL